MPNFQISQIFESIQGESIYSGFPFLFVRFFGCNVRCAWCDTKYSWENGKKNEYTLDDLYEKIVSNKRKKVLLTGGEPLLQKGIETLVEKLIIAKKEVHIETSGATDISSIPHEVHIIMDIKPPSAKVKVEFLESNLDYLKKNDEIKIVIDNMEDFNFMLKINEKHNLSERFLLSVSPTTNFLEKIQEKVMGSGVEVRINFQLHKHFFSDIEGDF